MKNRALFSSKDIRKKLKCCLLQFLFGTIRVNNIVSYFHFKIFNILELLVSLQSAHQAIGSLPDKTGVEHLT